jgi:DNA anti-recombination protein RmuC
MDTTKVLKVNIDKLSRAQQEMLTKARKADDSLRALQVEKEASERSATSLSSKSAVQDRQLKTFLQANEALEADLRKQLARVAQLERRKQEQEAEQQTIEAYYQARLEEMQSQYEKLLGEIDDAKKHAQDQVYRKFDSNAPVVPPPEAPGSPGGGVRSRPSPTKK